jgi:hypothetical protein
MGIYVKGMKMPKDCLWCPIRYVGFCQVAKANMNFDLGKKADDCPLVEVPEPHGRLIEAPDVSEYEVFDEDTGTREISLLGLMECHRMIEDAKTVIEAEDK